MALQIKDNESTKNSLKIFKSSFKTYLIPSYTIKFIFEKVLVRKMQVVDCVSNGRIDLVAGFCF